MDTERDLSKYRIRQAEQCLKEAKLLFDNGAYKGAANRAYYGAFHSIRSLLALRKVDFKSHKGVISYFRENYIKTNIFDTQLSKILTDLFQIRTGSDYDDYFGIEKDEISQHIMDAEVFFEQIKAHLEKTFGDEENHH